MMTKIYLVRHGETNWNVQGIIQGQTDVPLNDIGKHQALQCGEYLSKKDFDMIISSPLKRAKESAEIINGILNLPIIYNENLKERYFGIAEGNSKNNLIKRYPNQVYPGQESRLALNKRVMMELNKIIENHPNKRIIIVAHGAVINSMLSSITNHIMGSRITTLKNGSFTILDVKESIWQIKSANQTSHIDNIDD